MPLSTNQLQQLLDGTALKEQQGSPADHMSVPTGAQAATSTEGDWLYFVKNAADAYAKNTYVMLNLSSEGTPQSSSISCILNGEGMPNPVIYSFLPSGRYTP